MEVTSTENGPAESGTTVIGPFGRTPILIAVREDEARNIIFRADADGQISTVATISGEGVFHSAPSAGAGGDRLITNAAFEDGWFSCESYNGAIQELSPTGVLSTLEGAYAQLSADGRHMVYAAASDCQADLQDPNFVHAPLDAIVRLDFDTGEETRWDFPGAVFDSKVPDPVRSIALTDDRILVNVDGKLLEIELNSAEIMTDPAEAVEIGDMALLGALPDGTVLGTDWTVDDFHGIHQIDPSTGQISAPVAVAQPGTVALDRTGTTLVYVASGSIVVNGVPVEIDGLDVQRVHSLGF